MRIAAIGVANDGPGIEPVRYRDATPLAEFDAVLWNPNALAGEYAAELGEDGALSVAGSNAFLADVRRRRAEMRAFLDEGGSLVIEPPAPVALRVHTLEAIHALPLAQALPLDGIATSACRPRALAFQGGEPFRSFWTRIGDALEPTVRLDTTPGEALFRGADGEGVFGLYAAQRRGRVLFLPPAAAARRVEHTAALGALLDGLVRADDDRLPAWARRHVARDERPLRAQLDALEAERAALDVRIADAHRALHPFERRKLLFTAAGRPLLDAVADVFWALGCSVLQGPFGDTDLMIEHPAGRALAHVVAASGPIGAEALDRLDRWITSLAREPQPPKGLLIVNPHRGLPPERRPPLDAALIAAAAARGHLIVTGLDLLALLVESPADALPALLAAGGLWNGRQA